MKNFFKGLSFSQLFAGALAAITSFLLSSKIGIAGSVIGVAVASIVSTAASQIYKNVIDASSKKLQDAAQNQLGLASADPQAGDAVDGTDDAGEPTDSTQRIPVVQDDGEGERIGRTVSSSHGSAAHDSGTRPPMNARDKRVAIIVAVVSALVAVGATAGIILALTDGQGTDSVVRDIVHPTETTDDTRHKEPVITPSPTDTPTQPSSQPSTTPTPTPQATTEQPDATSGNGQSAGADDPNGGAGTGGSDTDTGNGADSEGDNESDTGHSGDSGAADGTQGGDNADSGTTQHKDGSQTGQ